MSVKRVTTNELRQMWDREGFVIQNCDEVSEEFVDSISQKLIESGTIVNGRRFKEAYVFKHNGMTNVMFPLDTEVAINYKKLTQWSKDNYSQCGVLLFSAYVTEKLGGFVSDDLELNKPDCRIIGSETYVLNLLGKASKTLKQNGLSEQAEEMFERVTSSRSDYEAFKIIGAYVNVINEEDEYCDEDYDFEQSM